MEEKTNRFLDGEASSAHELFPKLLSALIGDVIPREDEALARRNVVADLVHLAVDNPPLRLPLRPLPRPRRRPGPPPRRPGVAAEPPELVRGGPEALRRRLEPFREGEHCFAGDGFSEFSVTIGASRFLRLKVKNDRHI